MGFPSLGCCCFCSLHSLRWTTGLLPVFSFFSFFQLELWVWSLHSFWELWTHYVFLLLSKFHSREEEELRSCGLHVWIHAFLGCMFSSFNFQLLFFLPLFWFYTKINPFPGVFLVQLWFLIMNFVCVCSIIAFEVKWIMGLISIYIIIAFRAWSLLMFR